MAKASIPDSNDAVSKALNMLKRIRRLEGTALISGGVLMHDDVPNPSSGSGEPFAVETVKLFDKHEEGGFSLGEVMLGFDGGNVLFFNQYPAILALFFSDREKTESVSRGGKQFLSQFKTALGIQETQPIRSRTRPISAILEDQAKEEEAPKPEVKDQISDADTPKKAKPTVASAEPETQASEAEKSDKSTPENADMESSENAEWDAFQKNIEILFTKVLGSAQAQRIIKRELTAMGVGDGEFLKKTQFRPFGLKLTKRIRDKAIRKQLELELVDLINEIEE